MKDGKRCWRQFSLRGLLILVSAAALFLGWFAWRMRAARIQDAAAEEIVRAGGEVAYSDQFYGGVSRLTPYPSQPRLVGDLLRRLFGSDPTRKLVSVKLFNSDSIALISENGLHDLRIVRFEGGASITDEALPHLAECRELRVLYLDGANVTDQGLASLKSFQRLEELWLGNTRVSDASMAMLANLPALNCLDLCNTPVTDEGLKQVARMPALTRLDLDGDLITDEGIRHLQKSQSLWLLWLGERASANLDLAVAATIPPLESLTLTGSLVTDERVERLKDNASIRDLKFQQCAKLTDKSLEIAATMPNLKTLGALSSPFSPQAVADFKAARPKCHVW
jgi:hypothetical protein